MSINLHSKCCCSCPSLKNTTMTVDAGLCNGCTAPGTITPYIRGDPDCSCSYGVGPCSGPWDSTLWKAPQTFAASTPATMPCPAAKGQKFAVAKLNWRGRYGFTDDYIANPKVPLRLTTYDVSVDYAEISSSVCKFYGSHVPDGKADSTSINRNNSGSAHSNHLLTPGQLESCAGTSSAGDGYVNTSDSAGESVNSLNPFSGEILLSVCSPNQPDGVLRLPFDIHNADPAGDRTYNLGVMQSLCSINADRGIIQLQVPRFGEYSGPASGLGAWLSLFNYDTTYSLCPNGGGYQQKQIEESKRTVSLENFSLTNTQMSGTIKFIQTYDWTAWESIDNGDGTCTATELWITLNDRSEYTFNFNVTLSSPYTFAQAYADAQTLLNNFDFTNDKDFPWTMPYDCRIAPMISLWEVGGSPGSGYCDTPADSAATAIYDGSVKGALINYYDDPASATTPKAKYKSGIYAKGWFDFSMWIDNFKLQDDGHVTLCYGYGTYPSDLQGVSMATQVTTGSLDTNDRGAQGWQPFSRYLENWVLSFRPPFVDASCGFAADGGDDIYVSKYAEKKVNLPSENFFGPCGAMRNDTLLDSQCNPTATLRYPGAWSICGKATITSIVRDSVTGVVTVTLTDAAPYLITGDAVDFLDVSNAVTTANIKVKVDSATQFHFTGALPTGVAIKSHGAPDPAWYNLAPKGDFIWGFSTGNAWDGTNVQTILQDHLAFTGGILFVGPPGSPEINNPKWPSATTRIQSGYPALAPGGHWYCNPQQAMTDRYFTDVQDNKMNDTYEGGPPGGVCTRKIPPFDYPLVEAVSVAPTGAPYNFSTADGISTQPLPTPDGLGFRCSGIWFQTDKFSGLPYSTWPGTIIPPPGAHVPLASDWVTGSSASDWTTSPNLPPA